MAVEPPTRPVPPSTSTRALERGLPGAASVDAAGAAAEAEAAGGVRSGMHALTMAAMAGCARSAGATRGGLSHPCEVGGGREEGEVGLVRGCCLVVYVEAGGPSITSVVCVEAARPSMVLWVSIVYVHLIA